MSRKPKRLSEAQISAYEENGVVFPIPVLTSEEVSRFRTKVEELEARLGGKPKAVELAQSHLHFRWAYELSTHPAVLDAVEDVLGPNILVWTTSIFAKHPHDASYISWHQDGTYWGLDSTRLTSAWIALTDSRVENGCMPRVCLGGWLVLVVSLHWTSRLHQPGCTVVGRIRSCAANGFDFTEEMRISAPHV
ncbi:phytanoyl-CoA dioxygenase family protein [Acidobacteria bacterium AH-259-O06]|nr:phytanoyl-CoA dioxygenase family protein [Acidobacteria bacterium AH-259-O06]